MPEPNRQRRVGAALSLLWGFQTRYAHRAVRSQPTDGRTEWRIRFQTGARRRNAGRAPSFKTTVLVWSPGDTIPLSAGRTLQVVRLRHIDAEELPVLVVEDWPKERLAPPPDVS
jgi:hypothetical protein